MRTQPTKHPSHTDVLTLSSLICNCGSNTYPRFTKTRLRRYRIAYNAMSQSVCGPKTVENLPFSIFHQVNDKKRRLEQSNSSSKSRAVKVRVTPVHVTRRLPR